MTNPQNDFYAALAAFEDAGKALRAAARRLPELPLTEDHDDLHMVEVGYTMLIDGSISDGEVQFATDGWDNVSEDGYAAWVEADGELFAMPANILWS